MDGEQVIYWKLKPTQVFEILMSLENYRFFPFTYSGRSKRHEDGI